MLALRVCAFVANRFAGNFWLGLLVDNEALGLLEGVQRFLLDAVHQVVAGGNVVDQPDDLSGGPDLWK